MLFCEPFFLFFFLPLVLILYYATPNKFRNLLLTLSSLIFYAMGQWDFLGWLVLSILINYYIALAIERTRGTINAKRWLTIGIVSDLLLLVCFKYLSFLLLNLNGLFHVVQFRPLPDPHLLLPLGISFFTFHKITYKVDVYHGIAETRKNILDLALYILFFPQLIAGPIVRYHEIAADLKSRRIDLHDMATGIQRFILGLGKKMIIANTVAYQADRIFSLPHSELSFAIAWIGILCYTLQIYFDFSGYSDMAIGLARMFGFHFPENFNYPYISTSITEFWRRWHMSLSRFFRDYLYIPLGGNRISPRRTYANLVIVFLLCGFWHGASYNFIVWGGFHGSLLVIERLGFARWLERIPRPCRHAYLLLMVMIGWVLFRAVTLTSALGYLAILCGVIHHHSSYSPRNFLYADVLLAIAFGTIGAMPLRPMLTTSIQRMRPGLATVQRRMVDCAVGLASLSWLGGTFTYSVALIAAGTYNPFIYFRF